jgi:SAM-dependent methyltransferase
MTGRCWSCGRPGPEPFYRLEGIPISSCVLLDSRDEAIGFPKGDLELAFCDGCGFIQNSVFDPELLDYSQDYEESQGFSPTFATFAQGLVDRLVERYELRGKKVFEVGCGKGDFLSMLCKTGGNRGLGIDPGYREGRIAPDVDARVIAEFFTEPAPELTGDLICCRHTLEHIQPVGEFVGLIAKSAKQTDRSVVFFEVPDTLRILDEGAFWDVYYEHCSYFTLGSLGRLFRACGFHPSSLRTGYDDQYLLLEASLDEAPSSGAYPGENDLDRVRAGVRSFVEATGAAIDDWDRRISKAASAGKKTVIWGASSKGVAFLTSLESGPSVEYAVDINPFKKGRFLPGAGQQIVGPDFLQDYEPDLVVVMNSIYLEEIRSDLAERGLNPEMVAV